MFIEAHCHIQNDRQRIEANTQHHHKSRTYGQRNHDDRDNGQNQAMCMHQQLHGITQGYILMFGAIKINRRKDAHNKEHRTKVQTKDHPNLRIPGHGKINSIHKDGNNKRKQKGQNHGAKL